MTFRFEKLYADLVADDGTVCVAYVAWLDLLGAKSSHAGFELYTPDGGREVVRAARWSLRSDAQDLELELDVPGGPFVLRQRRVHGAWAPSGAPAHPDLGWSVKTARAQCTASWKNDASRPSLRGLGYADWVDLRRPTRSLGLRLLQWGRIHTAQTTLIFNRVHLRDGTCWARAAEWSASGPREWTDIAVAQSQRGLWITWCREIGSLCVEPRRVLHAGDPIDRERFPGTLERVVSSAITGPAEEERCVGRVLSLDGTRIGSAVYETVAFGARAVAEARGEVRHALVGP